MTNHPKSSIKQDEEIHVAAGGEAIEDSYNAGLEAAAEIADMDGSAQEIATAIRALKK